MQPNRRLLLVLSALATALHADTSLDASLRYARSAAEKLGPGIWKRVISVENADAGGRYPRAFAAVVFETGGILWFYTPTDGTQSLSLARGRVRADEADLGPLLRAIDPGFGRWRFEAPGAGAPAGAEPPNACFIDSLELLRREIAAGVDAGRVRLLSYYVQLPGGIRGHTVLYLEDRTGAVVIDPLHRKRRVHVHGNHRLEAKAVADCLRRDIASARWVPLSRSDLEAGAPAR
jgi:hypothetical protein